MGLSYAARLRKRRVEQSKAIFSIATLTGKNVGTVAGWERGVSVPPKTDRELIADYLNDETLKDE